MDKAIDVTGRGRSKTTQMRSLHEYLNRGYTQIFDPMGEFGHLALTEVEGQDDRG